MHTLLHIFPISLAVYPLLRPSSTLSLSETLALVPVTSLSVLRFYPIYLAHRTDTHILQLLLHIPYRKPFIRTPHTHRHPSLFVLYLLKRLI